MNRREEVLQIDDGPRRRGVYFYDGDRWPVGSGHDNGYLFRPYAMPQALHFSDRYRASNDDTFPVPVYMIAAFEAGEPIEPILDYLLEHYADTHPWLPEAVRRVCAAEGVGV